MLKEIDTMYQDSAKKLLDEIEAHKNVVQKIKGIYEELWKPSEQAGGMLDLIFALDKSLDDFSTEYNRKMAEMEGLCGKTMERRENIGVHMYSAFLAEQCRLNETRNVEQLEVS